MTAKNQGGMFNIDDVPYTAKIKTMGTCDDVTKGKVPLVGIEGWTQLPANNYKATMNAIAKVSDCVQIMPTCTMCNQFLRPTSYLSAVWILRHSLLLAIFQVGPVTVGVDADNWVFYEKGVFEDKDDTTEIDHAVLLVGYGIDENTGEKFFKLRNSWGPRFGESGYIRIKRNDDDDHRCFLDTDPLVGLACALDDNGNKIDVKPVEVCGADGILFDIAYPVGAHYLHH
jgi:hypothetical protein